jgi:GPH family glycoside/pentoside/hexuronide:cation symporter
MKQEKAEGLHRYAIFAAVLAAAGLPLYIHAPKFFVDTYDLNLTAIAGTLLMLRMLDFVQDPALGWLVDHLGQWRGVFAIIMTLALALAMIACLRSRRRSILCCGSLCVCR